MVAKADRGTRPPAAGPRLVAQVLDPDGQLTNLARAKLRRVTEQGQPAAVGPVVERPARPQPVDLLASGGLGPCRPQARGRALPAPDGPEQRESGGGGGGGAGAAR